MAAEPAATNSVAPITHGKPVETGRDEFTYVQASSGWRLIDLRELWQYRDLLVSLIRRDITIRYRQTIVGVAWHLLLPAMQLMVFVALFGLLGRQPAVGDLPYPIVALAGLLPWQLFAGGVTQATLSLVGNQQLIGKVYFPRIVLPIAAVAPGLADFAVAMTLLVGFMFTYGVAPTWSVLLLPLAVVHALLTTLALGIWLSALNGLYRDVGYTVPFCLQIGFFVSPVIYETGALIPLHWQWVYSLNPMVGVIDGFRWSLTGDGAPPLTSWSLSVCVTAVVLLAGVLYFRRVECYLADRL